MEFTDHRIQPTPSTPCQVVCQVSLNLKFYLNWAHGPKPLPKSPGCFKPNANFTRIGWHEKTARVRVMLDHHGMVVNDSVEAWLRWPTGDVPWCSHDGSSGNPGIYPNGLRLGEPHAVWTNRYRRVHQISRISESWSTRWSAVWPTKNGANTAPSSQVRLNMWRRVVSLDIHNFDHNFEAARVYGNSTPAFPPLFIWHQVI